VSRAQNFHFTCWNLQKNCWTDERTKMAEPEPESEPEQAKMETFASFAYLLSPLILRALADLGFSRPTRVQQHAIPLALENSDILARAPTGSGKTAAYCIPLLQKLLNVKAVGTLHGGGPLSRPPFLLLLTRSPTHFLGFFPLHDRILLSRCRAQERLFWCRLVSSRNKSSAI
jgi:ATP-dependent helicase YprA (DUF1998 family)